MATDSKLERKHLSNVLKAAREAQKAANECWDNSNIKGFIENQIKANEIYINIYPKLKKLAYANTGLQTEI